jgi:immunity protein 26 of polymorphic toxin system
VDNELKASGINTKRLEIELADLIDNFASEIGRGPSSTELAEILTWGFRAVDGNLVADLPADVSVKTQVRKGVYKLPSRSGKESTSVEELNDAVFVNAADLVAEAAKEIKKKTGSEPTAQEISDVLAEVVRKSRAELADLPPDAIVGFKAQVGRRKLSSKVGDIVAIPINEGAYVLASVVAKNQFGTALGLYKGQGKLRPLSIDSHPPVRPHPVYTGEESIASGRWEIIGHDKNLLPLFPSNPEIYHQQNLKDPHPQLGPFGSGETADGNLRELSKSEAQELGLLDGGYTQVLLPDSLEAMLKSFGDQA